MARTTRTAEPPVEAPVVQADARLPVDQPVPIDVEDIDFEAHVAKTQGGYTVTTAPAEG